MPGIAGRFVVLVAAALLLLAACGDAAPVARTAAQRLDDAVAAIAKALGKSTTEIRVGIERELPAAPVEELAAQAERTAARTAEMERLAAREAQAAARAAKAAERQEAMVDTLYGATCDFIDIADELASAPAEERWPTFEAILVRKLAEHGFDTGPANVQALSDDVQAFWQSVSGGSTRPLADIATDLACFAS